MFGFRPGKRRDTTTALAARQAIAEAQHPRVPEPTAKSILERFGPPCVATVSHHATILDALRVMAERDTAAVAVVSPEGLAGIFCERDYARIALRVNRTANDTPVAGIMSRSEAGVAPGDSVRRCLAIMNERKLTHVAVLDQGRLAGLLSKAELLAAQIGYHERIFHEIEMDQKLLFLRGTYSC